tara:strand:+ start:2384 stop:2665 length:282 start_codon:yes stop_codon:yes gene_type:complete
MRDLPKGLYRVTKGKVRVTCRVYDMKKSKVITLSCGVYPNLGMAQGAKEMVEELVGPNITTKKKVRITTVLEALNDYRVDIGLGLLKKKNTML